MVYLFSRRTPGALPRLAEIVLVWLLCFVLCVGCCIRPARAVGTGASIAVAGGAIGTGGIPALGALGTLLGPTLGVIGAVLLGAGVNVYVTEQSAAQGITKTQFLETSLRQWVAERGGSFDDLISTIAEGIHVSPLGQIALSGAASLLIYQFGNWLFANDSVVESPSTSGTDNVSIGDFSMHTIVSGELLEYLGGPYVTSHTNAIYFSNLQVSPLYSIILNFPPNNRSDVLCFVYPDTFTINYDSFRIFNQDDVRLNNFADGIPTQYIYDLGNGYKIVPNIYWRNCDIPAIPTYDISLQQFVSAVTGLPLGSGISLPSDDVFTGNEQDWLDNRDLLKPGDGDVVTLQNAPDLIGGAADALTSGAYNVSVPDYLSALADAYNNALAAEASIPLTLTDTATGAVVTEGISVATPFEDAALSTSIAPTDTAGAFIAPDVAVDAGEAVGVMSPDLTTIFPFCIPFDMARILNLLAADPVIPQYHVCWAVPYLQQPIEFDIDLTPLDGVMSVARIMETLLFVVGLALASRQMYLRG